MPKKTSRADPQILEMPAQKMAVVHEKGAPDKVFTKVMPALYGSVYALKYELKKKGFPTFKVSPPRTRYPNAHLIPKDQWTLLIGLPIPSDTTSLTQKVPGIEIKIETWEYGTVAQILHLGAYEQEQPDIEMLHKFIEKQGYAISGMHEEEYLTRPTAKVPKTIIRYPIKKK